MLNGVEECGGATCYSPAWSRRLALARGAFAWVTGEAALGVAGARPEPNFLIATTKIKHLEGRLDVLARTTQRVAARRYGGVSDGRWG